MADPEEPHSSSDVAGSSGSQNPAENRLSDIASSSGGENSDENRYWCHQCRKTVNIESCASSSAGVICTECRNGFVESVNNSAASIQNSQSGEDDDDEANVMDSDEEDDEDEWEEVEDEDESVLPQVRNEEQLTPQRNARPRREQRPRHLHHYLQEILQNLVGQNIEVRVEVPHYVGNPGDYVDARGFELVLQQLAENDNPSRRGAPPASKTAVETLRSIRIEQEHLDDGSAVCAVCKDAVSLGGLAKELPCLHLYHPDCILPWLDARNSCPVCRFELPTDDPDYEEQKRTSRGRNSVIHVVETEQQTELEQRHVTVSERTTDTRTSETLTVVEEIDAVVNEDRGRERSSGGWFFLTSGPVLGMVGIALVLCLGNHLVGSRRAQQQGGHGNNNSGSWQVHRQQNEFIQEPYTDRIERAGSTGTVRRRWLWWLPFQQR